MPYYWDLSTTSWTWHTQIFMELIFEFKVFFYLFSICICLPAISNAYIHFVLRYGILDELSKWVLFVNIIVSFISFHCAWEFFSIFYAWKNFPRYVLVNISMWLQIHIWIQTDLRSSFKICTKKLITWERYTYTEAIGDTTGN